jgi:Na+-transporting methylmalonyl-CoA/oxaloacetate decarboxylase gamma subunit
MQLASSHSRQGQLASSHSHQGLALVLSLLYILLCAIRQLTRHEENFISELRHQDEVVVDEDCKS